MSAHLYIEGANGDSKEAQIRCREGFRKLIESLGHRGKMPRLSACGGRESAFDDFKLALGNSDREYVAMLVDSEDPVEDIEKTWDHLAKRDGWEKPEGAKDDQVLLMATCMETWIVADRDTLRGHYGGRLQESALPALVDLEKRHRHDVQEALSHATRDCSNSYAKGDRSFEVLAKLRPSALKEKLPSFVRVDRIFKEKLQAPAARSEKPGKAGRRGR